MNEPIYLTRGQLPNYTTKVEAGKTYKFIITSAENVWFIEIPDILFNLNSAIPLLDKDRYLVRALFTAQMYSADNPDKELVIFGHADTSGEIEYNYTISEFRAKAVKAILMNDQDAWRAISKNHALTLDYQVILNTLDACYQWGCNCGNEDNVYGPKTKAALKIFQQKANEKYSCNLIVDGEIGPETWGAFLITYCEIIKAQHNDQSKTKSLTLGYSLEGGTYSCGESFPIDQKEKDNYQSELNRRVELLFFNKSRSDTLKPPSDKKVKLKPEECFPYDKNACLRTPVPLSMCGGEHGGEDWIEIQLNDENDKPVPNERYIIFADEGTKISGYLNGSGNAKIEKLFQGDYYVIFPDTQTANNDSTSFDFDPV